MSCIYEMIIPSVPKNDKGKIRLCSADCLPLRESVSTADIPSASGADTLWKSADIPVERGERLRRLLRTDDLDHLLCGNLYFYIHHSKRIPRYGGIKTIKKSLSEVQTPDRDFLYYKWANIEFCTNLSHKLKSFFEWGAAFYEAVQVCKLFLL